MDSAYRVIVLATVCGNESTPFDDSIERSFKFPMGTITSPYPAWPAYTLKPPALVKMGVATSPEINNCEVVGL